MGSHFALGFLPFPCAHIILIKNDKERHEEALSAKPKSMKKLLLKYSIVELHLALSAETVITIFYWATLYNAFYGNFQFGQGEYVILMTLVNHGILLVVSLACVIIEPFQLEWFNVVWVTAIFILYCIFNMAFTLIKYKLYEDIDWKDGWTALYLIVCYVICLFGFVTGALVTCRRKKVTIVSFCKRKSERETAPVASGDEEQNNKREPEEVELKTTKENQQELNE